MISLKNRTQKVLGWVLPSDGRFMSKASDHCPRWIETIFNMSPMAWKIILTKFHEYYGDFQAETCKRNQMIQAIFNDEPKASQRISTYYINRAAQTSKITWISLFIIKRMVKWLLNIKIQINTLYRVHRMLNETRNFLLLLTPNQHNQQNLNEYTIKSFHCQSIFKTTTPHLDTLQSKHECYHLDNKWKLQNLHRKTLFWRWRRGWNFAPSPFNPTMRGFWGLTANANRYKSHFFIICMSFNKILNSLSFSVIISDRFWTWNLLIHLLHSCTELCASGKICGK